MPWKDVWDRLNRPVLSSHERDVMFILIHNILPTRERLFRLNQCRSDQCDRGDGVEDVQHLFTGCAHTSCMGLVQAQDHASHAWLTYLSIRLWAHQSCLWISNGWWDLLACDPVLLLCLRAEEIACPQLYNWCWQAKNTLSGFIFEEPEKPECSSAYTILIFASNFIIMIWTQNIR